jgi:hypothetical protein
MRAMPVTRATRTEVIDIYYIMLNRLILVLLVLMPAWSYSQQGEKVLQGTVSFTSSKNIYVKFESTEGIEIGDTLDYFDGEIYRKALIVKQKSSSSCVTENLSLHSFVVGDKIRSQKPETLPVTPKDVAPVETPENKPVIFPAHTPDTLAETELKPKARKELITGRLSLSTNADIFSGEENYQRIRAGISFNASNIRQSAFSTQTYLTYRHRYGIDQLEQDLFNDLKVFTLAVQFAPNDKYSLSFGRKMNQHVANIGSIDGLQAEYNFNGFTLGTFLGTRPDFTDFSFNISLPQIGAYIVRSDQLNNLSASTTLAFAEQMNGFLTDRRFLYLQHNSTLFKRLHLFFSSEVDLFSKVDSQVTGQFRLTSLYFSARYRVANNLSFSTSYDNRRNVIYYESYQTLVEQLLAQETRHGLRIQANYNPAKQISLNASAFLRFQGETLRPTTNYVLNFHYNRVPLIHSSISLTGNYIEAGYFAGTILGGRISNSFLKGKLSVELSYRHTNYIFNHTEIPLIQHIAGTNISFNLLKRSSLMFSYEATLDKYSSDYHRYYITFVQRFKN